MRLLIVEDDLDGREMLAELFRMHDWIVIAVPTVGAALRELRAGGFDVIISDENLDGESGSSMLRRAFAEGLLSTVGALMYTAEPGKLEVPVGVRVLKKPLAIATILDEAMASAPESQAVDAPTRRSTRRCRSDGSALYVGADDSSRPFTALMDGLETVAACPPSSPGPSGT